MDKNNKTLLVAVLIMLLALVSFNFNKEDISGKAVNRDGGSAVVTPASWTCEKYDGSGAFTLYLTPPDDVNLRPKIDIVNSKGYRERTESLGSESFVDSPITHIFRMDCSNKNSFHLEFKDRFGNKVSLWSNEFTVG